MPRRTTDTHLPPTLPAPVGETARVDPPLAMRLVPDGSRYSWLGWIGRGGMGEVIRVWDRQLGRPLALKRLRSDLEGDPRLVRRFLHEARVTARLSHPGIVAVHDVGEDADGRPWYTLREVPGAVTLARALADTPRADVAAQRRLLEALRRVAESVGYAHARGVVHRDLKPGNVLLGELGEVVVIDWGLAHAHDGSEAADPASGTPPWSAPEQAAGAATPAADVHALGVLLRQLLLGTPSPTVADTMPAALATLVADATHPDPAARPADGEVFERRLATWLLDADASDRGQAAVARADAWRPVMEEARARQTRADEAAEALRGALLPWVPVEEKLPLWEAEAESSRAERDHALAEARYEQALRAALDHAPELVTAHGALADLYRARLERAEAQRDAVAEVRWEVSCRTHDRGRHAEWLKGDGALTLHTEPPGATVTATRWTRHHRGLAATETVSLGVTPLDAAPLARGSWLVELRRPGCATVRYPVAIGRQEHWDGVPPHGSAPLPLWLPREGELAEDDVYVPAGWCKVGGDPDALDPLPAGRAWVDGFVMRRSPVTCDAYLAFLDALVAEGREEEARLHSPRDQRAPGEPERLVVERRSSGRFRLASDVIDKVWQGDWPITLVDAHDAAAYTSWYGNRTNRPTRLPTEVEWEKAGRGVDGRLYPWGDGFEATWTRMAQSIGGAPSPAAVDAHPEDVSPYGVRGLAGNVRDWCQTPYTRVGVRPGADALLVVRGGAWLSAANQCRLAGRFAARPEVRQTTLGFRSVWPAPLQVPR